MTEIITILRPIKNLFTTKNTVLNESFPAFLFFLDGFWLQIKFGSQKAADTQPQLNSNAVPNRKKECKR